MVFLAFIEVHKAYNRVDKEATGQILENCMWSTEGVRLNEIRSKIGKKSKVTVMAREEVAPQAEV